MRKQTIAERRAINVVRLAQRHPDYTTRPEQIEADARRIMNSFYRLAALSDRVMEMENNSTYYERHRAYVERESERAYNWHKRLNKELAPYNCHINGTDTYLCEYVNNSGAIRDLYLTEFYD